MKQVSRLERAISAVKQREPQVQAFAFLPDTYQPVLPGLTLSGLPVAVKDLIDTEDMPTGYGCSLFEQYIPQQDAWIVQKLKAAGAIIFKLFGRKKHRWLILVPAMISRVYRLLVWNIPIKKVNDSI